MNPQHPFLSCSFYTSLHTWCISQKWTLRKWLTAKQKKPSPSRLEWIEARKPHRPPHGHRGAWSRNWSIPTDYRILIDSEMIWLSFEQFLHSYFEAWTKSVAFLSCGSRLCAPCWHQQLSTNLAITLISMMSPESLFMSNFYLPNFHWTVVHRGNRLNHEKYPYPIPLYWLVSKYFCHVLVHNPPPQKKKNA